MIRFQLSFDVLDHDPDHSDDGNDQGPEGESADVIAKSP